MKQRGKIFLIVGLFLSLVACGSLKNTSSSQDSQNSSLDEESIDPREVYMNNGNIDGTVKRIDILVLNMDNAEIIETTHPSRFFMSNSQTVQSISKDVFVLDLNSKFWLQINPVPTSGSVAYVDLPTFELNEGNDMADIFERIYYCEGEPYTSLFYRINFTEAGEYSLNITFEEVQRSITFIVE